jgi:hypothetical protein
MVDGLLDPLPLRFVDGSVYGVGDPSLGPESQPDDGFYGVPLGRNLPRREVARHHHVPTHQ